MNCEAKMRARQRIEFLIERDGKICKLPGCKRPTAFSVDNYPTTDHIIPVSKGGPDEPSNWQLAHRLCNERKADRLILPDGTLEPLPTKSKPARVVHRPPTECCFEGRLLVGDEICPDCGSEAQPKTFPKWKQRGTKDCDHDYYHCWLCVLGFVDRKKKEINDIISENNGKEES